MAAAGAPALGSTNGAPASRPASPQADASTTSLTTSDKSEAPQLQVNGANPATINVGDSCQDLGATITGPTADLNLGTHLYIDVMATDAVQAARHVSGRLSLKRLRGLRQFRPHEHKHMKSDRHRPCETITHNRRERSNRRMTATPHRAPHRPPMTTLPHSNQPMQPMQPPPPNNARHQAFSFQNS
jgi:hypothetical protein